MQQLGHILKLPTKENVMAEEKFSEYTQGLLDTVISLRKEVANLREAYSIIHNRIDVMATLADKTTGNAVKEAIDLEELARLAVVAADVAHKAAVLLLKTDGIDKTQKTLSASQDTYDSAQKSTVDSKARQTSGGGLKDFRP
jgi:hypothetical protein